MFPGQPLAILHCFDLTNIFFMKHSGDLRSKLKKNALRPKFIAKIIRKVVMNI